MSDTKPETIADIVSQIRAAAYLQNADSPSSVMRLADRIEAAWKREETTWKGLVDVAKELAEHERKEANRRVEEMAKRGQGNAAAMREALVAMVKSETDGTMERDDLCGRCMSKATMGGDCKHDGSCWVDKVMAALAASPSNCVVDSNAAAMREYAKRLVDAVKDADLCDFIYGSDFCKSCMYNPMCKAARDCEAALSAPPRNCDVGTAEEQSERMALFCKSMYATEGAICHKCPLHEHKDCTLGWAQMPYTEGGAE